MMSAQNLYICSIIIATRRKLASNYGPCFFNTTAHDLATTNKISNGTINISATCRWVLSHIKIALGHHLSCACKIRKHGTILHRSNGDLLLALSKALLTNKNNALTKLMANQQFLMPSKYA